MRSTRSHKPWTNPPTNRGQIPHHFQQNIAQILTISLLHGPYKNPAGPTRPRHLPKRNSVKQRTDANHLRSKSPLLLQRAWTLPDSGGEEMGRICRVQTSRYIVYRQLVSRKKKCLQAARWKHPWVTPHWAHHSHTHANVAIALTFFSPSLRPRYKTAASLSSPRLIDTLAL